MVSWLRHAAFGAIAALAFTLSAPPAAAQPTAEQQADKLNDEGKALWKSKDIPAAAAKFQQAIYLSPQAKYYVNLCYMLHQLARYEDSLRTCRAVANAEDPTPPMLDKADRVIADIKKRKPELFEPKGGGAGPDGPGPDGPDGPGPDGPDGPGPDGPDGTGPDGPDGPGPDGPDGTGGTGGGNPNQVDASQFQPTGERPGEITGFGGAPPPVEEYIWSLGVSAGFLANAVGDTEGLYAGAGQHIKVSGNYLFAPATKIGVQGSIAFSNVGSAANPDIEGLSLQILDLGVAVFKHTFFRNLYVTPAAGVHIAAISPDAELAPEQAITSFGIHAETGVSWLFGPKKRHVISVVPALNFYFPGTASGGSEPPDTFGLDEAGLTFTLSVGYTLRFLEPFGQSPFFTLE